MDAPPGMDDVGDIDLANALDLSESEEEEEMEDIINDFSRMGEEEVNPRPLTSLSDELTRTCTGSELETRAHVLLPVPHTLPHVRLPYIDKFRAKRKSRCPHQRSQTRLVFGRYQTSCTRARARGCGQGEATGTRRWCDRPARDIPERRSKNATCEWHPSRCECAFGSG